MCDQHMTNEPPPPLLSQSLWPVGHTRQGLCLWAQEAGIHWDARPAVTKCQLGVGSLPRILLRGRLVAGIAQLLIDTGSSDTAEQGMGAGCQLGVSASWEVCGGHSQGQTWEKVDRAGLAQWWVNE